MFLNAEKFQGCSFWRVWVVKGKPTEVKNTPPPRLNYFHGASTLPN